MMIGELELLAEKQQELDAKRALLNTTVEEALCKLEPLREQMKDVIQQMKEFHEMQSAYIDLSKQTYEILADNMESVGKEIEQTRNLLNEGDKLSKSALPINLAPLSKPDSKIEVKSNVFESPSETVTHEKSSAKQEVSAEELEAMFNAMQKEEVAFLPDETVKQETDSVENSVPVEEAEKESYAEVPNMAGSQEFWSEVRSIAEITTHETDTSVSAEILIPANLAKRHPGLSPEVENEIVKLEYELPKTGDFLAAAIKDDRITATLLSGHNAFLLRNPDLFTAEDKKQLVQVAMEKSPQLQQAAPVLHSELQTLEEKIIANASEPEESAEEVDVLNFEDLRDLT